MRPLNLMMQAFGPYAEKEEIDFRKLGNRTMFVISGKTGSGKTTIFDGISYAIYGKASGEDRNGNELRSQFAKDNLLTEVSLLFSLRNKLYYIWRSPQQEKKKERGDGYTTVNAKAELYAINHEGKKEILAGNVREVDEKIRELIQLDANQFRQILMIPQGEFRKLLISDSKEKEVILQRLFSTQFYKMIEERLKAEATELKNQVHHLLNERNRLLGSIQPYSQTMQNLLKENTLNEIEITQLLDNELLQMKNKQSILMDEYEKSQKAHDEIIEQQTQAKVLLDQFTHQMRLQNEKIKLDEDREKIHQLEQDLLLANRSGKLAQQEEYCRKLSNEKKELTSRQQKLQEQFQNIQQKLEQVKQQYEEEQGREGERNELAKEINQLESMKPLVYSFSNEKKELALLQTKAQEVHRNKQQTQIQLEKIEKELEQIDRKVNQVNELKVQFLKDQMQQEKTKQVWMKLNKIANWQLELQKLHVVETKELEEFQHIERSFEDAKATLQHLEENWRDGQAGLLAEQLLDNAPCPVCGSTHHPNKAMVQENLPSEEDLKAAKETVLQYENEKHKKERKLFEYQSKRETLEYNIQEESDAITKSVGNYSVEQTAYFQDHLQQEMDLMNTRMSSNADIIHQHPILVEKMESLKNMQVQEKEQLATYERKENEVKEQYIAKRTQVEKMTESIPETLHQKEVFDKELNGMVLKQKKMKQRLEETEKQYYDFQIQTKGFQSRLDEMQTTIEEKNQSLETEKSLFLSMMKDEQFVDYKHYEQSKRSEDQINKIQQQIRHYHETYRSITDRLQELNQNLQNVKKPDLIALDEKFKKINEQLDKINQEMSNIQHNIRFNERIQHELQSLNVQLKELEEQYKMIGDLSDIACGQNVHRLTFERFVLAAFLDDILHVANQRLTKMTSGRYQLLRKTERAKGNTQSGLELLVFDQYTGQERHVKTLSGGESFKAALSLALGLAEVVQQYSGGVSLETMFIDEGFGTLDPESLDQAIESLMEIQNSGRLVGIISHVPELKERIDARLEVVATQKGSYTQFHFFH
ncbi:exonuclease SbcC [Oikeobacillus pervagus]|uniref:Nuclease SbcCD subunit C n=1 Tax=Oikeobacillus pervagus TaxID=1325931 RepID=A0AAJ1T3P5_9BACI|nr:SMC family ATPase [Oikeobacillus pervagus]MDQ0214656.1 exonuclease SbcC [Oikeobacillus pervagus]